MSVTLRPSGVGDKAECFPSAGANWECVDEVVADDDTSYVSSSVLDDAEYIDLDAVPDDLLGLFVTTITVYIRCRSTNNLRRGAAVEKLLWEEGGTKVEKTGTSYIPTLSYQDHNSVFTLNAVCSFIQIGVMLRSKYWLGANYPVRCTHCYAIANVQTPSGIKGVKVQIF